MTATHNPLLKLKAYKVFVAELNTHLSCAKPLLAAGGVLDVNVCRELSGRFHTVKGGAGFFGLDQLHELAAELEDLLLDTQNGELERARAIFSEFELAAQQVPDPV